MFGTRNDDGFVSCEPAEKTQVQRIVIGECAIAFVSTNAYCAFQITTVSLLQSDSSTLSSEQWTHLSNIVHCYDEYSLQSAAVRYVQEQSRLPVRIRFHSSSLHNLFVQLMTAGQFLFKNNGDFVTFVPSDQSLIVQNAAKMVAGFSLTLIGSTSKIFVTPVCRETLDNIYGKSASDSCQHAGKRLDTDETFVKLMISALIFSTFRCTEYMEGADSNTISDVKTLLRIQNQYIEIAWRYMVYKYDHQRAVRGFSNLILSLMHLHESLVEVSRVEKFNQTVDSLIEKSLDMSISKT